MNREIIDMHIHFGAPKDEVYGCFWSDDFKKSVAYFAMLLMTKSLFKKVNIHGLEKNLLAVINGSLYVQRAVLLALDLVFDETGKPHPEKTHLYVSNQYLAELARKHERVLWGASVHPYRPDWREALDFCLANGAVLCKMIPSSQLINPDNPDFNAFYQKLADHDFPLLCHTGSEYAIPTSNAEFNQYNNPKYLRRALEQGVTVIVAHCALPYFWKFDSDYQDDFNDFLTLCDEAWENNWKLYADISAFGTPMRSPYIEKVKARVPPERLLFGSDYPVPLFSVSYHKSPNFLVWLWFVIKMIFMRNPLDKNYRILKAMQFDERVFYNAADLFAKIKRESNQNN